MVPVAARTNLVGDQTGIGFWEATVQFVSQISIMPLAWGWSEQHAKQKAQEFDIPPSV